LKRKCAWKNRFSQRVAPFFSITINRRGKIYWNLKRRLKREDGKKVERVGGSPRKER